MNDVYAAGFFDGEGSICIEQRRAKRSHCLSVCVINTNLPILEALKEKYGGSIGLHARTTLTRRQAWSWKAATGDAKRFLEAVYPWLTIKKEEAWIGLEFMAQRTLKSGRNPVSDEELALREGYRLALINARRSVSDANASTD